MAPGEGKKQYWLSLFPHESHKSYFGTGTIRICFCSFSFFVFLVLFWDHTLRCSGVTLSSALRNYSWRVQEAMWILNNWTWVNYMQSNALLSAVLYLSRISPDSFLIIFLNTWTFLISKFIEHLLSYRYKIHVGMIKLGSQENTSQGGHQRINPKFAK